MVDVGAEIGQFDEVVEILLRGVPAAAMEIIHEGRAVDGSKADVLAAHDHVAFRVAGQLRELFRGFGDIFFDQSRFEKCCIPFHLNAVIFENLASFFEIEIYADFRQDFHRFLVDQFDAFFLKYFIDWDVVNRLGHLADFCRPR